MRLSRIAVITAGALMTGSVAVFSVSTGAQAQSTTTVTTATPVATSGSTRDNKLASEFSTFAGSQDNAQSLVTGLRQGGEVTLVTPTSSGQAVTSTTFTAPTRPMGYGNVRISLALAQEQLIRAGITRPTGDQLRAALVGGTVTSGSGPTATTTELQGVLQMRAQGMGWGQIANGMGTKLGHVMSGLKQTNRQLANGQSVPGAGTGSTSVTTAAGTRGATNSSRGNGRGPQVRSGGEAGAGIVTAAGGSAVAGTRVETGGGARGGAGLVTGSGASAGARASTNGLANGKGHAKP
jgi:hypothetical protein